MSIHYHAKKRQYLAHKEEIDRLLVASVTDDTISHAAIETLEKALSEYVGAEDVIVCNTQYNAFVLLFMVLGVKAGDEVITSPLGSGIAVQAALFMGAKIIFVDVEQTQFTLDIEQVEDAITERTKLIIPVSQFGSCADMESINTLALKHDLCVIEDAAESFGSLCHGQKSTQLSKLATTSFYPTMPLHGFGNGAALFIADTELRNKARELRSQGKQDQFYHSIGIEACMDRAQAAVVAYKLSFYDEEIAQRQNIATHYQQALESSGLVLPQQHEGHNFAYFPVQSTKREEIISRLDHAGIETKRPFIKPLHLHPAFEFMDYAEGDFPVCEQLCNTLFLLPLHAYLSEEERSAVISELLA